MKKTTINLTDELTWDLKQVCIREQRSQQNIISNALGDYLKKYKAKNSLPEYPLNK